MSAGGYLPSYAVLRGFEDEAGEEREERGEGAGRGEGERKEGGAEVSARGYFPWVYVGGKGRREEA